MKTNNLHQNIIDTSKNKDLILKNCKKNVKSSILKKNSAKKVRNGINK